MQSLVDSLWLWPTQKSYLNNWTFLKLDIRKQKLERIPFFIIVNLSNHKPSLKASRYSLLKQDVY